MPVDTFTQSEIRFTPLSRAIGADVTGLDLRQPLNREQIAALIQGWHTVGQGLLRFRGQALESEDIVRLKIGRAHV